MSTQRTNRATGQPLVVLHEKLTDPNAIQHLFYLIHYAYKLAIYVDDVTQPKIDKMIKAILKQDEDWEVDYDDEQYIISYDGCRMFVCEDVSI